MRVVILPERDIKEISGRRRVDKILHHLEINPETVLVIKNGELLTADHLVEENEEIEIWPVMSGGGGYCRNAL